MIDEVQENLVTHRESAWGKPSIEIKGNFTWSMPTSESIKPEENKIAAFKGKKGKKGNGKGKGKGKKGM